MTPLAAALAHARRGIPALPLYPRTKIPAAERGFYAATLDEGQIRAWWRANPGRMPALATGHPLPDRVTGEARGRLMVVDIDADSKPHRPIAGEAALRALLPHLPPTVCVETGSGGLHLYYLAPLDGSPTIGAGMRVDGQILAVDWRCRLGYVVAPGARHARTGRAYRYLPPGSDLPSIPSAALVTGAEIAHAPASLLALCAPRDTARTATLIAPALAEDARLLRYGSAALSRVEAHLRSLGAGERHRASYGRLCGIGELIGGGCLDLDAARVALVGALVDAGLTRKDAGRLVDCGLRDGMGNPKRPRLP